MDFKSLVENAQDLMFRYSFQPKQGFEYVNSAAKAITGYTPEEFYADPCIEYRLVHSKVRFLLEDLVEAPATKNNSLVLPWVHKNGSLVWVEQKVTPIYDEEDNLIAVEGVVRDITRWKQAEEELQLQRSYFETLFDESPLVMAILNEEGKIIKVNKNFQNTFKYKESEAKDNFLRELIVPKDEVEKSQQLFNKILKNKMVNEETVRKRKDGSEIEVSIIGTPIEFNDRKSRICIIYKDITERKKDERQIKYLSFHDELTGLYNRVYFERELELANSQQHIPLSLIVADVNNLKLVNDVFGHGKGDELLKIVAKILKESCRENDIVVRWGGDEFIILLPNTTKNQVELVVKRIKENIPKYEEVEGPFTEISIALGYVTKESPIRNIDKIMAKAEDRMYRNKLRGSKSTKSSIISSLETTLLEKNYETKEHADRLEKISMKMGKYLGLSNNQLDNLDLLARLHDIGKVAISDEILMKPAKLTEEEWERIKMHPEIGCRIANSLAELTPIANIILSHHERWDGTGYPQRLKGENIPLLARIIAICDAYDVMTNERPYKTAMSHQTAITELKECAESQFDPELVKVFIELFDNQSKLKAL
ncbi:diguanylate cyclase domain-containing protein [Selenihalanaerobacter shriftii]|uniref:PAS domain S-box-containing protein/diguanylate cyclase (GGDEF) domain-containing protein n=1 Tax=Selenihalanaerobacter shriftii TaxID=142842 RepID=A0A1T4KEP3_9FIRM|nr:HD domain-containing phosphohydrolase [Selenihalanaerobacter shriftii]SJZ40846.1 PAS domain S-box-containing protein/diguanylate cyclase (GGDEF) domain-containing protein [Selenihalanaerobacter shriftii]